MTDPEAYWRNVTSMATKVRVMRVLPRYARHFVFAPYRRGFANTGPADHAARVLGRHAAAGLDTWIDSYLRACGHTSGARAGDVSGALAVRYIRLMAAINKEFEHRLAVEAPLDLDEVLRDPVVHRHQLEWVGWCQSAALPAEVVRFMELRDFTSDYTEYAGVASAPGFERDPRLQMKSIELDSGGYLARLGRLVAEAREVDSPPEAAAQSFDLGVAAKLADDLADLATDAAEGRYNLLLALTGSRLGEQRAVGAQLARDGAMPVTWWQANAPDAFAEFTGLLLSYRDRLTSRGFRDLADLAMARASGGPRRRQTSRAHRMVSETPLDPWR